MQSAGATRREGSEYDAKAPCRRHGAGRKCRPALCGHTADAKGIPHLAIAERITLEGEDTIGVTGWFCHRTAENVDENAWISLVVWNERRDAGFQLIGEVTQILDLAMLDGFIPDETETVPQIERKLEVRVNHILTFGQAHHSDLDLA